MKLSVIIVNYNVKYFLDQCLISVRKSMERLNEYGSQYQSEVIVVDNNSVDNSVTMIREKFPEVRLITNKKNVGFSKANNQGIRLSKGEYVLLLNPDTVVEEDTFLKVVQYLDANPEAGGLGVKMIDGSGNFLPESKRGFPSPWTAFYKISGLSRLFPRSKKFGRYHLGFLSNDETHEIEVLSGAFMLVRRVVLDKTGLLDESFFMYGEDIDLSYRVKLAGYKNVYYPETQIIHYKGESTKRGSLNYVFLFYKAMIIFARKHFSKKNASLFSFFINIAIYARAMISVIHRFLKSIYHPLLDGILIFSGLLLAKWFWESNDGLGHGAPYPRELAMYIFPLYTILWLIGLFMVNAFSKPFGFSRILKGILLGTIIVSSFYAFFEESIRFSRAIIILGTFTSFFSVLLSRVLINAVETKNLSLNFSKKVKLAIIGYNDEAVRVHSLLQQSNLKFDLAGYIYPEKQEKKGHMFLGDLEQLDEIIRFYRINELVFCSKDISSSLIIGLMTRLEQRDIIFKIAPPESLFVIGSHDKNQTGDYYTIDIKLEIVKKEKRINKRILDIATSLIFFVFSPFLFPFQKTRSRFFGNLFSVLTGRKSWVGYSKVETQYQLPQIKEGVFNPTDLYRELDLHEDKLKEFNLIYARNYSIENDIRIIWKNIFRLGKA